MRSNELVIILVNCNDNMKAYNLKHYLKEGIKPYVSL